MRMQVNEAKPDYRLSLVLIVLGAACSGTEDKRPRRIEEGCTGSKRDLYYAIG
jgi:hypothetical protein